MLFYSTAIQYLSEFTQMQVDLQSMLFYNIAIQYLLLYFSGAIFKGIIAEYEPDTDF